MVSEVLERPDWLDSQAPPPPAVFSPDRVHRYVLNRMRFS